MSVRGERATWIAVGVLVAAALVFAVASLERQEREIEIGFQGEARTNPLLGAERFLTRMGLPARRAGSLAVLPPPDHTIVLALPGTELNAVRSRGLLDWVEDGGHVIATVTGPGMDWDDLGGDPLLQACGVVGGPADTGEPWEAGEGIPSAYARREERRLTVTGERRPLSVLVRTDVGLVPGSSQSGEPVSDPSPAPVVATCRFGRGRITVIADLLFATNAEIGDRDHARLLWRLAALEGPRAGVWMVREDSGPSLAALVLDRGLPLLVALVLLGTAAAARGAVRFGPVLPLPPRGRRSLLEHVEAVGALLWRQKRQDVLLKAVRASLSARTAARRPALLRLKPEEGVQALAAGSGVDPEALRAALERAAPDDPEGFVRAVRTLQTVRRSL